MLTLYQQQDSGNCYKVRLVLKHLRRPFRTVAVSSFDGSTREPEFLAKNPIGKLPTIRLDDGRFLAESNAILLHFSEGSRFLPADSYDRAKTYVASLCAIDADMLNFVDAQGRRTIEPPDQRKKGMIWAVARKIDKLGAGNFVSSASQHIYVRGDSVWANPYRVTWADVEKHWTRPHVRKIEPFCMVDLSTGAYHRKHPSQRSAVEQITDATADDDWAAQLSDTEWNRLAEFVAKYETLRRHFDYLDFIVGGERRRIWIVPEAKRKDEARLRGIGFHVPKNSLMATAEYGFFDDILIGNFMRTELHNAALYPHFTPLIAKLGGAAKVYTNAERRRFNRRYFRRNPLGYLEWHFGQYRAAFLDHVRWWSERFGLKQPLKIIYRRMIGDPVV